MDNKIISKEKENIVIYTTDDGQAKVEAFLEDENIWLSQEQIAKLFDKSKSTINEHIMNIYEEGELNKEYTMRKFGFSEFSTKPTNYYNLELIIAVGYRVKSNRGTQLFTSMFISWSKIETPIIQGVQGRYFIPIIPLVFLLIGKFLDDNKVSRIISILTLIMQIYVIMEIVLYHI